jgi:hypothetical protein
MSALVDHRCIRLWRDPRRPLLPTHAFFRSAPLAEIDVADFSSAWTYFRKSYRTTFPGHRPTAPPLPSVGAFSVLIRQRRNVSISREALASLRFSTQK